MVFLRNRFEFLSFIILLPVAVTPGLVHRNDHGLMRMGGRTCDARHGLRWTPLSSLFTSCSQLYRNLQHAACIAFFFHAPHPPSRLIDFVISRDPCSPIFGLVVCSRSVGFHSESRPLELGELFQISVGLFLLSHSIHWAHTRWRDVVIVLRQEAKE